MIKTNKTSSELLEEAYKCKNKKDLENLLEKIEYKIQLKHNHTHPDLLRAKTITTTKLLLKK